MGKSTPVALAPVERVGLCALQYVEGRTEACRESACAFWEEGGAVAPAGCLIQRLGIDLEARPELPRLLLRIRRKLERARTRREEDEARELFYRLVPAARAEEDLPGE